MPLHDLPDAFVLLENVSDEAIPLDSGNTQVLAAGEFGVVRDLSTPAIQEALADGRLRQRPRGPHHDPGERGKITTGAGVELSGTDQEAMRQARESGW